MAQGDLIFFARDTAHQKACVVTIEGWQHARDTRRCLAGMRR